MIPNMGKSAHAPRPATRSGLSSALFSATQQRVLGFLFGQPDRSFFASELIGMVGAGSGAVQRELARLEKCGLVTVHRIGNQRHYQADPASPIFNELVSITRKTFGLAEPLREALASLAPRVLAAFVYGSIAKAQDTARSDIDLMIVSDEVTYPDLIQALQAVQSALGRSINPTVFTRAEFALRRTEGSAFVTRVLDQPKIWLIGAEDDVAA